MKPVQNRKVWLGWLVGIELCLLMLSAVMFVPASLSAIRWPVLVAVLIVGIVSLKLHKCWASQDALIAITWLIWTVATALWSVDKAISNERAIGIVIVVNSLVFIGFTAGKAGIKPREILLFPLLLFVGVGILIPLLLGGFGWDLDGQIDLYQGLATNPNALAVLCVISLGYPASGLLETGSELKRILHVFIYAGIIVVLYCTGSRAAFIGTACGSFLILGMWLRRKVLVIMCCIFLVAGTGALFNSDVYSRVVLKGHIEENGVLFSRMEVWQESFEDARAGGLAGLGLGVTNQFRQVSFTVNSFLYGREKGNSQLAMVEETGVVSLGLYLWYLSAFAKKIIRRLRSRPKDYPVGVIAIMLALTAMSLFESWWVGIGSTEFGVWWCLYGYINGVEESGQGGAPDSIGLRLTQMRLKG